MTKDFNVYVGIDPGVRGALAWAYVSFSGEILLFSRKRKDLTLMDMMMELESIAGTAGHPANVFVLIEQVGAFSLGRQACFKLGESMGEWKMACLATEVGFTLITPQKWQSIVGLPKKKRTYSERKRDLRQLAQQHYPGEKDQINVDTQDAILLAHACWMSYAKGTS